MSIIDRIDQLVDQSLQVGPVDDYNADRYDKCPHCSRLSGAYDEIRYALRNCDDTPEGHAELLPSVGVFAFGFQVKFRYGNPRYEFYNECAELIFPDAQHEEDQ